MTHGLVDFVTTGCKLSWIENVWGKPVPQLLVGVCEPAFMPADKQLRERKAYGYGILTKSIGKKEPEVYETDGAHERRLRRQGSIVYAQKRYGYDYA